MKNAFSCTARPCCIKQEKAQKISHQLGAKDQFGLSRPKLSKICSLQRPRSPTPRMRRCNGQLQKHLRYNNVIEHWQLHPIHSVLGFRVLVCQVRSSKTTAIHRNLSVGKGSQLSAGKHRHCYEHVLLPNNFLDDDLGPRMA